MDVQWYLIVILIFISLMTNAMADPFMCNYWLFTYTLL